MMYANATKIQTHICECKLQMIQKESLHVAIGVNANANENANENANLLSDWKSLHTQDHSRVAHATQRGKKLHWSPNHIRHSYSSFTFKLRTGGILALGHIRTYTKSVHSWRRYSATLPDTGAMVCHWHHGSVSDSVTLS